MSRFTNIRGVDVAIKPPVRRPAVEFERTVLCRFLSWEIQHANIIVFLEKDDGHQVKLTLPRSAAFEKWLAERWQKGLEYEFVLKGSFRDTDTDNLWSDYGRIMFQAEKIAMELTVARRQDFNDFVFNGRHVKAESINRDCPSMEMTVRPLFLYWLVFRQDPNLTRFDRWLNLLLVPFAVAAALYRLIVPARHKEKI